MHDEPTTMGGDPNWKRPHIHLRQDLPPIKKHWTDRMIGPLALAGVAAIYYFLFKIGMAIWERLNG